MGLQTAPLDTASRGRLDLNQRPPAPEADREDRDSRHSDGCHRRNRASAPTSLPCNADNYRLKRGTERVIAGTERTTPNRIQFAGISSPSQPSKPARASRDARAAAVGVGTARRLRRNVKCRTCRSYGSSTAAAASSPMRPLGAPGTSGGEHGTIDGSRTSHRTSMASFSSARYHHPFLDRLWTPQPSSPTSRRRCP